jgi:hypothetical protein
MRFSNGVNTGLHEARRVRGTKMAAAVSSQIKKAGATAGFFEDRA